MSPLLDLDIKAVVSKLLVQAGSLQERIEAHRTGAVFKVSGASEIRAERWRRLVNKGDPSSFTRRLLSLGIQAGDLPTILGEPEDVWSGVMPDWACFLKRFLEWMTDSNSRPSDPSGVASHDPLSDALPFAKLYSPLIEYGRELLCQEAGYQYRKLLSASSQLDFENYLLKRLVREGSKIATLQFTVFQAIRELRFSQTDSESMRLLGKHYEDFLGASYGQRLLMLFTEYPVHARHCSILVRDWVLSCAKFLRRLAGDHNELGEIFHGGVPLGKVTGITVGLSDPHHGGETVMSVTFDEKVILIYKPRCLGAESHFSHLLEAISSRDSFRFFKAPKVCERKKYGWVEYVRHSACSDLSAVKRFYWRAGALLGIIHLSWGIDFHWGNQIAAGEHPVLVDLDSLWHPQDQEPVISSRAGSVLRTGFLPGGHISQKLQYTFSALESDSKLPLPAHHKESRPVKHLPCVGDSPFRASRFTPHVKAGYRWIGRKLLSTDGGRVHLSNWLNSLRATPRRYIHRSTGFYIDILRSAGSPKMQREGVDYSIELEALIGYPSTSGLEADELRALERLDIPYFLQPTAEKQSLQATCSDPLSLYMDEMRLIEDALRPR